MALIQCDECNREVSDKADACPHCGYPMKKQSHGNPSKPFMPELPDGFPVNEKVKKGLGCFSIGCLTLIGLFVFVMILAMCSSESSTSATQETSEKVSNSSWDGSVHQVERYLQNTLKDPDSFEAINWSRVEKVDNGSGTHYRVLCKYRAKNSFGGYVIETRMFYMDAEGDVLYSTKAD